MGRPIHRVVALAGPSGVGKSHAARTTGLPCLETDAFFLDEDDPRVPTQHGRPDWEDVRSFDLDLARSTLGEIVAGGHPPLPDYSYLKDARVGWLPPLDVTGPVLLVEGTFAFEVASAIEPDVSVVRVGLQAGRWRCAWSRVVRDLRDHRQGIIAAVADSLRHGVQHSRRLDTVRSRATMMVGRREIVATLVDLSAGNGKIKPA